MARSQSCFGLGWTTYPPNSQYNQQRLFRCLGVRLIQDTQRSSCDISDDPSAPFGRGRDGEKESSKISSVNPGDKVAESAATSVAAADRSKKFSSSEGVGDYFTNARGWSSFGSPACSRGSQSSSFPQIVGNGCLGYFHLKSELSEDHPKCLGLSLMITEFTADDEEGGEAAKTPKDLSHHEACPAAVEDSMWRKNLRRKFPAHDTSSKRHVAFQGLQGSDRQGSDRDDDGLAGRRLWTKWGKDDSENPIRVVWSQASIKYRQLGAWNLAKNGTHTVVEQGSSVWRVLKSTTEGLGSPTTFLGDLLNKSKTIYIRAGQIGERSCHRFGDAARRMSAVGPPWTSRPGSQSDDK